MPVSLSSQVGNEEQADAHLALAIMSEMRASMPGIGKQRPETYNLAIRQRILRTLGEKSIIDFNTAVDGRIRRVSFTVKIAIPATGGFFGTNRKQSESLPIANFKKHA